MAKEISVSAKLSVTNGGNVEQHSFSLQPTQATAGAVATRQSIPTSDTVITLSGVTAPRWISIKNVDLTNYVDIGNTAAGALVEIARLQPSEGMILPLFPGVVLRGKAHTGAVVIEKLILET